MYEIVYMFCLSWDGPRNVDLLKWGQFQLKQDYFVKFLAMWEKQILVQKKPSLLGGAVT